MMLSTQLFILPLDKLLNYKFGNLEWRSLKFEKSYHDVNDYQGSSVINYPELKFGFTRIHEPKHLHPERNYIKNKTLIIKEFPLTNNADPYYPINDTKNREISHQYKNYIKKKYTNKFMFGGRLSDYAYYDMDMTISAALTKFEYIKKIFS